jgi:hypothetical protein
MNGDRVNIWKEAVVILVTLEYSLREHEKKTSALSCNAAEIRIAYEYIANTSVQCLQLLT